MNATKFYVAACRLVIEANPDNINSWQVGWALRLILIILIVGR